MLVTDRIALGFALLVAACGGGSSGGEGSGGAAGAGTAGVPGDCLQNCLSAGGPASVCDQVCNGGGSGGTGAGTSTGGAAGTGAGTSSGGAGGGVAGSGATGGGGAGAGGGAGTPGTGGVGGSPPGCPPTALAAGQTTEQLVDFAGTPRGYRVHVPAGYDGSSPLALVLQIHGLTFTAARHEDYTSMSPVADANGFAVVYPDGLGASWNGGACCGSSAASNVDDVGFIRAVVADVSSKLCVDSRRVYASGMSNGGFLSHRLACEAADLVAAIAPVAGVLGIDPANCQPSRPVPVMHFHGTSDLLVPYGGNPFINYPSVASTIDGWANRNGCTDAPVNTFTNGAARCETRSACAAGATVTLCTVDGMGHCWPGRPSCTFTANTDIIATEEMWRFFEQHALP